MTKKIESKVKKNKKSNVIKQKAGDQTAKKQVVNDTPVKATKKKGTKIFCLGCGCSLVVLLLVVTLLVVFWVGSGGSFIIRGEGYDGAYNYDALVEAPWISDPDKQQNFLERKQALEDFDVKMDGAYYKDIMETDLEEVYTQLIEEGEIDEEDYYIDPDSDEASTSQIVNVDYDYSFTIDNSERYIEVEEEYELSGYYYWVYTYCYQLDDDMYDSGGELCQDGYIPLFAITVFIEEQYDDYMADDPFSEFAILLTEGDGLYFLLDTPNGELPDEIWDFYDTLLDQVQETFEYTSHDAG